MSVTYNPTYIKIGDLIATNRKLQGYTQEEFAHIIGISIRALSKIENGYNLPSLSTASLIDSLLNISIMDLLRMFTNNPEQKISILYNEYNLALNNRNMKNLNKIYNDVETLSSLVSKNSIRYKKYLFIKSWHLINSGDIVKAYQTLEAAYKVQIIKSEENRILNYKIYLLRESIAPDLETSIDGIERVAKLSMDNLIRKSSELQNYPELRMKYLYNSLIIKMENLEDYSMNPYILIPLLQIALKLNSYTTYFQTIFYRGILNYYNGTTYFYLDIDEALAYFYIQKNQVFFDSNVDFLRKTILKTY